MTAGYSGTPLPRKLGIREESRVLLLAAPPGFQLGPLPPRAVVQRRRGHGPYDVIVAFCPARSVLTRRIDPLPVLLTTAGGLWVCWPKKAGTGRSDLDENMVREHGLATGLVDVKVAAVDAVWSGLKFVRRTRDR